MGPLATESSKAIKAAIKKFGVDAYEDKGPKEVMDFAAFVSLFRALTPDEAVQVMRELLTVPKKNDHHLNRKFVSALLTEMQDWEELWVTHEDFCGEHM